jgi:hypothetical protein
MCLIAALVGMALSRANRSSMVSHRKKRRQENRYHFKVELNSRDVGGIEGSVEIASEMD